IEDGGVKDDDYTLTVNIVGNGTVTKEPNYSSYKEGTNVTLTAIPDNGYQFSGWSGAITGTDNPVIITMNSDKTITAIFSEEQTQTYTLTINVNPIGAGTVTKNPNQQSYKAGSQVSLTVTPNSGYQFSNWSGDATGTQNPMTVTLNSNLTITANFFTLLPVKNGSVTSSSPPPPDNIHGYDFSSGQEVGIGAGDFNFEMMPGGMGFNSIPPAGIQKLSGVSFDDLNTAPETGYSQYVTLSVGNVLVFKTREGYYGKAEIISLTIGPPTDNVTFKYAVQLDKTTNLRTK
ncbi:MAG: InlB B-repeat-containing protein, partial [Endomicrobia bacterium]|nr:InlB B-repeat-containing protein [Endomicrobiia bacterium]